MAWSFKIIAAFWKRSVLLCIREWIALKCHSIRYLDRGWPYLAKILQIGPCIRVQNLVKIAHGYRYLHPCEFKKRSTLLTYWIFFWPTLYMHAHIHVNAKLGYTRPRFFTRVDLIELCRPLHISIVYMICETLAKSF